MTLSCGLDFGVESSVVGWVSSPRTALSFLQLECEAEHGRAGREVAKAHLHFVTVLCFWSHLSWEETSVQMSPKLSPSLLVRVHRIPAHSTGSWGPPGFPFTKPAPRLSAWHCPSRMPCDGGDHVYIHCPRESSWTHVAVDHRGSWPVPEELKF